MTDSDAGRWASDVTKREPEPEEEEEKWLFCAECEEYQNFKKAGNCWKCEVCGNTINGEDPEGESESDENTQVEELDIF
jgi:ribosomal protein L37AE/L43A